MEINLTEKMDRPCSPILTGGRNKICVFDRSVRLGLPAGEHAEGRENAPEQRACLEPERGGRFPPQVSRFHRERRGKASAPVALSVLFRADPLQPAKALGEVAEGGKPEELGDL